MRTNRIYVLLSILIIIMGCNKSSFLDAKPDQSLIIPKTLEDFQAILDNSSVMTGSDGLGLTPSFGEIASDNYFIIKWPSTSFLSTLQNLYTWNDNIYSPDLPYSEWDVPYKSIFYANLALDGLNSIKTTSAQMQALNNAKGSALFYRAHMHYQLAQIYSPQYEESSASEKMGIILRKTADINEKLNRSNLKETYESILSDLLLAKDLLPDVPLGGYKTRPSKVAAFGLLARVFQTMKNYSKALEYSNAALSINNQLLDYNSLDSLSVYPVPQFNKEVIFSTKMITIPGALLLSDFEGTRIDTTLLSTFHKNDLRRIIFFNVDGTFRGSYGGSPALFSGMATDEIYLIRAECNARAGNISLAMTDLNALIKMRWKRTATYSDFSAVNKEDALSLVLTERRKELIFRGLRWSDLRRLNSEGANINITRKLNGATYSLPANSKHYTYLLPPDVLSFNPGMKQNER